MRQLLLLSLVLFFHLNSASASEYFVTEWEEVTVEPIFGDEVIIVPIEEEIVMVPHVEDEIIIIHDEEDMVFMPSDDEFEDMIVIPMDEEYEEVVILPMHWVRNRDFQRFDWCESDRKKALLGAFLVNEGVVYGLYHPSKPVCNRRVASWGDMVPLITPTLVSQISNSKLGVPRLRIW